MYTIFHNLAIILFQKNRYDQAPEDCGPDGSIYCHYDSYRRFINLKQNYPNFKPMISIGRYNNLILPNFVENSINPI